MIPSIMFPSFHPLFSHGETIPFRPAGAHYLGPGPLGQRRLGGSEHRHAATLPSDEVLSVHAHGQVATGDAAATRAFVR